MFLLSLFWCKICRCLKIKSGHYKGATSSPSIHIVILIIVLLIWCVIRLVNRQVHDQDIEFFTIYSKFLTGHKTLYTYLLSSFSLVHGFQLRKIIRNITMNSFWASHLFHEQINYVTRHPTLTHYAAVQNRTHPLMCPYIIRLN